MGVQIKTRGIEEIVVECKTGDSDKLTIIMDHYGEQVQIDIDPNVSCILLTKEDAKKLGEALIKMVDELDE